MKGLLVIGGTDPTGGAGITADVLHAHDLGLWALPVAAGNTVQSVDRFGHQNAVDAVTFTAALEAARQTMPVIGVKIGMLPTAAHAEYLGAFLRSLREADPDLPIVLDPVVQPSAPGDLQDRSEVTRALADKLVSLATVVTPNRAELGALVGEKVTTMAEVEQAAIKLVLLGADAVLVSDGDPERRATDILIRRTHGVRLEHAAVDGPDLHGGGCALSTRIAAHLARGLEIQLACQMAGEELVRLRRTARRPTAKAGQSLLSPLPLRSDAEAPGVVHEVESVTARLAAVLPSAWIAECGNNLAYTDGQTTAVLRERIRLRDSQVLVSPAAWAPPTSHVARVARAAARTTDGHAAALNLRHVPELLQAAEVAGLSVGHFDRADEPADASSSVEWGTRSVFQQGPVDLVADPGADGKEPMVRLIAEDPEALLVKLARLVEARSDA